MFCGHFGDQTLGLAHASQWSILSHTSLASLCSSIPEKPIDHTPNAVAKTKKDGENGTPCPVGFSGIQVDNMIFKTVQDRLNQAWELSRWLLPATETGLRWKSRGDR